MDFWNREPSVVAQDLASRVLVVGDRRAAVLEADAFSREDNQRGAYRAMLTMAPGSVYCVRVMGHVMLLIVTADGSCVRIKCAQVQGVSCSRPGVASQELGLVTHKQRGAARTVDDRTFRLELEAV